MKRLTIYLDDCIHKALNMKSDEVATPVSKLVNDAVRAALLEDAEDLAFFRERADEPVIDFETSVTELIKNSKF